MKTKDISKLIESILLESALDARIKDGVVDLTNAGHIDVLFEVLKERGLDDATTDEMLETMVTQEGKYPERQAYNKDGWLVTFPSKEYKDAALKRGTHFGSDPTHGRGGMHLYYKRRGKQKRQTQQQPTVVKTPTQQVAAPTQTAVTTTPLSKKQPVQPAQSGGAASKDTAPAPQEPSLPPDEGEPLSDAEIENIKAKAATSNVKKKAAPAISQKSMTMDPTGQQTVPQAVNKKDTTEKFARSKGWVATPFGEWRDPAGDAKAVVSLSGEITPINANDREELKLFAERQP